VFSFPISPNLCFDTSWENMYTLDAFSRHSATLFVNPNKHIQSIDKWQFSQTTVYSKRSK